VANDVTEFVDGISTLFSRQLGQLVQGAAFMRLSLKFTSPAVLRLGKERQPTLPARFSGLISCWLQPDAKAADSKHAKARFGVDALSDPSAKSAGLATFGQAR
jgi:hypothetical protein